MSRPCGISNLRGTTAGVLLALAAACTGQTGPGGGTVTAPTAGAGGSVGVGAGGAGGDAPPPAAGAVGVAPLRRLTNVEYRNTVRDLLQLPAATALPALTDDIGDSYLSGFARGAAITTGVDARQFLDASEQLAAAVAPHLSDLLPCKPIPTATADQDACAKQFITQFGLRAFRRPLNDDEVADLVTLYMGQRDPASGGDFATAVTTTLTAMLQSPYFLYRWELGTAPIRDGDLIRFNSYEIASRLSYFLWASMPDATLFSAAAGQALQTPKQIADQARRMMTDTRFKDVVRDFHGQWLASNDVKGMQKAPEFTIYNAALTQSMLDETADFAASILWGPQASGKFEDLLTSSTTVADAALAKMYGVAGVTGLAQTVKLDPTQRAGVLTQASFLASHATADSDHPVRRGVEIIRHLLCTDIEIPTNIMVPPVKDKAPGQSTRDQFSDHGQQACATACHGMIDPIGFAFEHYDAIGQYRTMDGGKAVDSSGATSVAGLALKFDDAIGLAHQLAGSSQARSCMATEWFRYLVRRREVSGDSASLQSAMSAFTQSSFDVRELIVALTQTTSFTHRSPSPGEVF